ncbi:hemolysin-like protein [Agrilactobacillus composti DSM 18527 = JCM 14202]|uniref:Hemolysin-like protein n=1 Tax=Agrilactobacillus composti DSM 18527 = JCM 14202 TaxID=1423734 RepID=X0PNY6_9LACO|nr:hemolysin family protein [Agrilactobacillus composti]KRM34803.1 hemolysin-like protein [Agrilactobacillus composti DSM 18527 = JCM 14202]GAF38656.1 hemolysin and related protein containing CBS domains [Agrilactobacillus composti DSM 18527 = JCM 14202]
MDEGQLVNNIIIILVIFFLAAFFVAAEFALVQTRASQLEERLKAGTGSKRKLNNALHMVKNLNEYLSTTQVGTSMTGIILGWIGEDTIRFILVNFLGWTHLLQGQSLNLVGAILGVAILTYLEVVITEIVPKNISIDMPVKMLMAVVTPLKAFHTVFYPFVWLLNKSALGIVKMIGLKPADEENEVFSQSEILRLTQMSVTGGQMDQNDYLYMQRAFDLNDKVAKDIMVDRTSLYVVDITDSVDDVIKDYLQQGYSRFPVVAENDKDKILGYVYAYDLVRQDQVDGKVGISRLLRSIITVPESMPIQDILNQMIKRQTPIVVVVDEYGGTSGIVTDKDIYEELFGTVKDEIDDVSDEYIIKQSDKIFKVSGKTTLYDFERYFHSKIESFEDSEATTVAGYIIDNYPDLKSDSVIDIDHFEFKVIDYEHAYVNWFEVTVHEDLPHNPDAIPERVNDAPNPEDV